jgi:CRP/FNR family transcriptional regulator, cyclic AMP receptor protein
MNKPDCSQVQKLSITDNLSEAECQILTNISQYRSLRDGDVLLGEGEIDNTLYGIVSGRLEAVKDTGMGDHVTLQMYKAGDIVGELGFIDGTPHSASLLSIGDSEVITLERSALEELLQEHPAVVYGVMRGIIRTTHAIVRRMNLQYVEMCNYISKQHGRY